ncbi:unnamed protein product [Ceutorhynchus assimilis]|uniref:Odorant receptor n=1 Tax=Ceutorhynchus assimilis TaxID=467358 RepID=A0A9P0GNK3_9CUCU|nr:unnamed protein product [Ceutorhynchus assimilis]
MNFVFSSTDLTKISEVFALLMTQFGFINKLVNFHLNWETAYKLEELLSKDIFTKLNEKELHILKKAFDRAQKVINIFLILCVLCLVLYGIFPVVDNKGSEKKNYLFPGKFPFNPDKYYPLIYGVEILALAISAWSNAALDCLFTKHTVIATTFFTILCEKIKGLLDNIEDEVEVKIKNCAIYYEEVINYVSMIEKTFSYGIFVQFLCSAIVFCLTGFQLTLVVSHTQFALMAIYFSCMMCQLVLYCWYGHQLIEESDSVTNACYAVKWEEMGVKEQKMLMIIMERAKRPIGIKAAGMFGLNLSTLMKILRSSYSYFAVLQRIYKQ